VLRVGASLTFLARLLQQIGNGPGPFLFSFLPICMLSTRLGPSPVIKLGLRHTRKKETQHTIMNFPHDCSPTKSVSKLRRNIRITQTNQHLRFRSRANPLVLFSFVLLCMCACMYPCVAFFSNGKLTVSSQSLSTKSVMVLPFPLSKTNVIQGMRGRRSVAEDESLSRSR